MKTYKNPDNNNSRLIKALVFCFCVSLFFCFSIETCTAFWIWTPGEDGAVDPKTAAKDTPEDQFEWAMDFYEKQDFKRSSEEFVRLTEKFAESDLAPEAQYYAGRSFEEMGKYSFAFENYQKTVEKYPYTNRLKEIVEREFNIANIFQTKEAPKLMELELNDALDKAVKIYGKVVDNQTFGEYADKALYNMAECYRRMMKYSEAMDVYSRLISDYPSSPLTEEAKYQLAYTTYEASLDPEYDQESTDKALEKFRTISKNTAVPRIAEEADLAISVLRNRKANSIMKVAEFYEKQKKYSSAIVYYKDVLNQYADSDVAQLAEIKVNELERSIE